MRDVSRFLPYLFIFFYLCISEYIISGLLFSLSCFLISFSSALFSVLSNEAGSIIFFFSFLSLHQ